MTKYLLAGISLVAIAAVAVAGVQSTRLSSAKADLAAVEQDLAASESARRDAERSHRDAIAVLAVERRRADQAARTAQDLRDQISKDAGTDRDGETAPVLEDVIRGLGKTSTSAVWMSRQSWLFTQIVAGRVEIVESYSEQAGCIERMVMGAEEVRCRPGFVSGTGSLTCHLVDAGRTA